MAPDEPEGENFNEDCDRELEMQTQNNRFNPAHPEVYKMPNKWAA